MNTSTPSLKEQMIWVLSDLSNLNAGLFAKEERLLKENAQQLKEIFSTQNEISNFFKNEFNVVWGPALINQQREVTIDVYKAIPKELADQFPTGGKIKVTGYTTTNAMYVTKGKDPQTGRDLYVVAVSGTNPVSQAGWFQEDFDVKGTPVSWPPQYLEINGLTNVGAIAQGSNDGLELLWTVQDPDTNQTLYGFLESVISGTSPAEVAVCGHSLGGALSPLVATALADLQPVANKKNVVISAYPTAGPTSGDADFAKHVYSTLNGNYVSRINDYDVVPHGWQESTMDELPNLYSDLKVQKENNSSVIGIPASTIINGFIFWAKGKRGKNVYNRIQGDIPFKGSIYVQDRESLLSTAEELLKNVDIKAAFTSISFGMEGFKLKYHLKETVADFLAYMMEAGVQHTSVYGQDCFNIPGPLAEALQQYVNLFTLSPEAMAEVKEIVVELVKDVASYVAIYGPHANSKVL
ncbi:hypothetical protein [uncultured Roseivirga sp.]|uniref:lipase family protein n=1 Tax=uncultured Roseivirga sp. TaxID=543088 RepID=UPI0030DCB931|tara:strand:+ start:15587 stop:16984 length:1398 start_codon:yes stop_codon:yes gene_type:complete